MRVIATAIGIVGALVLVALSLSVVTTEAVTGSNLSGGAGQFFTRVPQLIVFVLVPLAGVALAITAWKLISE